MSLFDVWYVSRRCNSPHLELVSTSDSKFTHKETKRPTQRIKAGPGFKPVFEISLTKFWPPDLTSFYTFYKDYLQTSGSYLTEAKGSYFSI